jgi:DNA-binding XRE family transcriptional regulator
MGQDAKPRILTPALCRGARGLLDWSQADLAERAAVSRSTIKDFEVGAHELHRATEALVLQAFEAGGITIRRVEGLGIGLFAATPEPSEG